MEGGDSLRKQLALLDQLPIKHLGYKLTSQGFAGGPALLCVAACVAAQQVETTTEVKVAPKQSRHEHLLCFSYCFVPPVPVALLLFILNKWKPCFYECCVVKFCIFRS